MRITISPSARTVRCRACIGGEVVDGDTIETCPICGGSERTAPDATYGVIDADGGRLQHDGRAESEGAPGLAVLVGMNRLSHVYAGTVPAATVARRRKANKAARAARRVTRRSAR